MYENIKYNRDKIYHIFDNHVWRITNDEIEDIFLEVIDKGFYFAIIDPFTRSRMSEIKHLESAIIYIGKSKETSFIGIPLMQKFISRLEYLNLKIKNIEVVNNNYINFLVKIECYL